MIKYIIVIPVLIGSVIFSQDIIHTEKDSTDDYIQLYRILQEKLEWYNS